MNAICRRVLWFAVPLCLAGVFTPPPTDAAPAGAACLAPINAGEDDPQPRDVHFIVAPDKTSVTVTACIVSNAVQFSELQVTANIFDAAGRYLNRAQESLGGVTQTVGTGAGNPKIVATVAINVDIKPTDQLLQQALIVLDWIPCNSPAAGQCDPGDRDGSSFLRDAAAPVTGQVAPYPDIPKGKDKR
jgi:hypothetical protein